MTSKDEARDKMAESLIDLCDFKVTLPLSEKTKNIHTNSWIYFEPVPDMDKMDNLYSHMGKNKSTRWVAYRKGFWYVKNTKVTYTNSKETIELTLSPFPTVFNSQSMEKQNASAKTSTTETVSQSSSSDGIKAPDWLSKSDREWAEKTVRKAIGTKKSPLKRAKAIYKEFKAHYKYSYYKDLRYTTPKGNRKKAYNRGSGNCADGANILETLMLTGGINARIKHAPNHYIVKLKIDGKTYWVDNHSRSATWNQVWRGVTSNSEGNISEGVYING